VVVPEDPGVDAEVTVTIYDEDLILPIFEMGFEDPGDVYLSEEEENLTINPNGSATFTMTADILENGWVWIGGEHPELGEAYAEMEMAEFLAGGNCDGGKELLPILDGSPVIEFDPLEESDAGEYFVEIWYGPEEPMVAEFVLSPISGSVPVSGLAALGLLGGACALTGVLTLRRRKK